MLEHQLQETLGSVIILAKTTSGSSHLITYWQQKGNRTPYWTLCGAPKSNSIQCLPKQMAEQRKQKQKLHINTT